jgi:putative transposase
MLQSDIDFFDCKTDWLVFDRKLPHWIQAGAVCFVTWRLEDSLPLNVLNKLDVEIEDTLRNHDLNAKGNWKQEIRKRSTSQRGLIQWHLFAVRDRFLDAGCGKCLLSIPSCAQVVVDGLFKFDEDRYFLTDLVVMPNHVHFIAAFQNEECFLKQCADWKRYMARQINQIVGRIGKFWQVDQFDHLIRSFEQFEHYRRYIRDNPTKANLASDRFKHVQKQLVGEK